MSKISQLINLPEIRKALTQEPNVLAAYLTGSQVRGFSHEASDVDIAILLRDPRPLQKDHTQTYLKFYHLLADYVESATDQREIDIIFLQAVPIAHQFHAIREGKRIYSVDLGKTLKYEECIYNRYADQKPQLDLILGEYIHAVANA